MIGDWLHNIFDVSLSGTRGDTKILSPVARVGVGQFVILFPHAEQLKETGFWIRTGPPNHLTGHLCPLESGSHMHNNLFTSIH